MFEKLLSALADTSGLPLEHRLKQVLALTADQFGATIASLWRYNRSSGYCSCFVRTGYEGDRSKAAEFVLRYDDSLISEIVKDLTDSGNAAVALDLAHDRLIQRHWATNVLEDLALRHLTAVPFYNSALPTAELRKGIRGLLLYYFKKKTPIPDALSRFLSLTFSDLYSSLYLKTKDDVTDRVIDTFADQRAVQSAQSLLETVCKTVCVETMRVEACSIYEWSPLHIGYRLSATTGVHTPTGKKLIIDRKGSGLISVVAERGVPILMDDIGDIERTKIALGRSIDEGLLKQNAEVTTHPQTTGMFIPVRNPILPRDHLPSAIIKFVNKRHPLVNFVDFFDVEDQLLGEEIARMIALYEEQARGLRQQEAFALQFGHEAQAPAVGIRGTADRILYRLERGGLEPGQIASMARDMFDFAEIMISFAESLTFGFGDRTLSRQLRYKFRQTNLRASIEAARKVVIPICREEEIQFDNIRLFGRFPLVFVDNRAFMQVFYNLMTNAIKYRVKDKPKEFGIQISHRFISSVDDISERSVPELADIWKRMRDAEYIREGAHLIDVSDFGMGILEEEATKVFWEGFRSPRVSPQEIRGSGVGLTIVRNILADFDCLIWVEHTMQPTTFRILIPDFTESSHYARRDSARRWSNG